MTARGVGLLAGCVLLALIADNYLGYSKMLRGVIPGSA